MRASHFRTASVRWLLLGWVIAWSMLITQPCCYAGAAPPPGEHARYVPYGAEWCHTHALPKNDTDHDHCDDVISGALTTVATDSTSAFAFELPPPLATPSVMATAITGHVLSFALPRNAASFPPRRAVYLATARLRI